MWESTLLTATTSWAKGHTMPHRYDHYDSIDDSMQEDLCPLCHGASQDSYLQGAGALRQRLERLEHLTHDVLLPAHQTLSPIARRVVMAREPEAPQPEQTLWQGRPALLAAVPGLVWAGAWTGLWSLASWQYQAIVAHVVQWHPLVRHGLRQMGAVKLAWWYSQGAAWLTTHAPSDAAMQGLLLALALGSAAIFVCRCRRAGRTSYCLTTHRLSTQQGRRWVEVDLAQLDRVALRRPFWGRVLAYVHLRFLGRTPGRHPVQWWGVPQRAFVTALLQATLHQARAAAHHKA
jgi:hypothetical protein